MLYIITTINGINSFIGHRTLETDTRISFKDSLNNTKTFNVAHVVSVEAFTEDSKEYKDFIDMTEQFENEEGGF